VVWPMGFYNLSLSFLPVLPQYFTGPEVNLLNKYCTNSSNVNCFAWKEMSFNVTNYSRYSKLKQPYFIDC
jgi:hypothetical protein